MSLNISQRMLDVSSNVTMTVDLTKLGTRQMKSLIRYLRSGSFTGGGVPAQIAESVLQTSGKYLQAGTWQMRWFGITDKEFHDKVKAIAAVLRMSSSNSGRWFREHIEELMTPRENGSVYLGYIKEEQAEALTKFFKQYKVEQPAYINKLADDIEAGLITTLDIALHKGN